MYVFCDQPPAITTWRDTVKALGTWIAIETRTGRLDKNQWKAADESNQSLNGRGIERGGRSDELLSKFVRFTGGKGHVSSSHLAVSTVASSRQARSESLARSAYTPTWQNQGHDRPANETDHNNVSFATGSTDRWRLTHFEL